MSLTGPTASIDARLLDPDALQRMLLLRGVGVTSEELVALCNAAELLQFRVERVHLRTIPHTGKLKVWVYTEANPDFTVQVYPDFFVFCENLSARFRAKFASDIPFKVALAPGPSARQPEPPVERRDALTTRFCAGRRNLKLPAAGGRPLA